MSILYPHDWRSYLDVILIFFRCLGFFVLLPVYSHKAIPLPVKLLLGFAIALAFRPVVGGFLPPIPEELGGLVWFAIRETIIGLLMGFSAHVTFAAFDLAAHLIGLQMGLGTVALMDPSGQSSASLMVPLHGWIAILLFFILDLHHESISCFVQSFAVTKALGDVSFDNMARHAVTLVGNLFVLAFQMSAPFTLLILAINTVMGVLGKMMPQLNVFFFVFPITLLSGFACLWLVAPNLVDFMEDRMLQISADVMGMLRTL